jgi:hypothetical protein
MATALKRLLTLGMALAFLVGTTIQPMPVGMAQTDLGVFADLADGCAGSHSPCPGHMRTCPDHVCCVIVSALPASLGTVAVAVEWRRVYYSFAPESLSGIIGQARTLATDTRGLRLFSG